MIIPRTFPFLLLVLLFSTTAWANKPNMIFIIADDCTFRDIGCYGGQAKTPHIDKLATEGMRFTRCFQAAPMCSPTRHNLYTGLYPVKSGAYPNHTFVKDGVKSVVQHLKPLGYRVALSGKRHVNPSEVFAFEGKATGNNPNFEWIDEFMAECKKSETPFCLFACSNEPHSPWNKGDASKYPPEKLDLPSTWVDTPEQRDAYSRYLAEITYYDSQLGECMRLLGKHGMAENTLLIFTSEQGSAFPFAKWTCYDTGLHNGFVARWPQVIKAGTITEVVCMSKPFTVIPMVVTRVQPVVAAGQLKPADVLLDAQQRARPGTLTVVMEPLYEGGLSEVMPGSKCIANAYTSNHELLEEGDLGFGETLFLHMVDTVGVIHAIILRMQALLMPVQMLVFAGH